MRLLILLTIYFLAFPDAKIEVKSVIFSEDRECVECIMTGTHSNNGFPPDLIATGLFVTRRIILIEEFKGDKIILHVDYHDLAIFLNQLGVLPKTKWFT